MPVISKIYQQLKYACVLMSIPWGAIGTKMFKFDEHNLTGKNWIEYTKKKYKTALKTETDFSLICHIFYARVWRSENKKRYDLQIHGQSKL